MPVLLRARRLDHDSAERSQSAAGKMATMIPGPSRHKNVRRIYRTAVKPVALFQKRTIPGTGQRIAATSPLAPCITKRLPAEAEIGEGGILADKGILDAGEVGRQNIDHA